MVGLKSDLAEVSSITIPQSVLNLSGATGDREVTIDLNDYLPEGAQLMGTDSELTVVLKVEALEERTFELPTSRISQVGASSLYSYQYDQDSIQVVVRGLTEDLDQLNEESLTAEVDVSDMEPGPHQAAVTFDLGAAYEVVSYDSLQIVVHDRPQGASGGQRDDREDAEESAQSGHGSQSPAAEETEQTETAGETDASQNEEEE